MILECCRGCRFISPIVSAIIVTILFGLVRTFVLRSQHSFKRAFYVLPVLVMLTFFVIVIFILQTNNKNQRCAPSSPMADRENQTRFVTAGCEAYYLPENLCRTYFCNHLGGQPAPLDSRASALTAWALLTWVCRAGGASR